MCRFGEARDLRGAEPTPKEQGSVDRSGVVAGEDGQSGDEHDAIGESQETG